jgi:hypothetical protein
MRLEFALVTVRPIERTIALVASARYFVGFTTISAHFIPETTLTACVTITFLNMFWFALALARFLVESRPTKAHVLFTVGAIIAAPGASAVTLASDTVHDSPVFTDGAVTDAF